MMANYVENLSTWLLESSSITVSSVDSCRSAIVLRCTQSDGGEKVRGSHYRLTSMVGLRLFSRLANKIDDCAEKVLFMNDPS